MKERDCREKVRAIRPNAKAKVNSRIWSIVDGDETIYCTMQGRAVAWHGAFGKLRQAAKPQETNHDL